MTDYIKREDVKHVINKSKYYGKKVWYDILDDVYDIPSADVAPVRHGHWIEMSYDEYKCSACENVVREEILYAIKPSDREDDPMHIANYCPCCGSKMDGEK